MLHVISADMKMLYYVYQTLQLTCCTATAFNISVFYTAINRI